MARYGMVLNLDRCIGCYNCQVACKDEHVGNDFPPIARSQPTYGHFWIGIREVERVLSPSHIRVTYIPIPCQQCGDAPCVRAATNGAIYRRSDGIVIIDPAKAAGQKQLVESCPYGVIFWNEKENLAQKCTFCAHLLDDGWSQPRCVQTCPARCMSFGDLDGPRGAAPKTPPERRGAGGGRGRDAAAGVERKAERVLRRLAETPPVGESRIRGQERMGRGCQRQPDRPGRQGARGAKRKLRGVW